MDEYEDTPNSKKNLIIIGAIVAIVATVAAGGFLLKSQNQSAQKTNQEVMSASVQQSPSVENQSYEDGTYEAMGDYISPGGAEQIKVTVVLKDDVITKAEVEPQATRPNSVKFQGLFKAGFEPLVVGKNIDTVALDKVSGSSLAPKGFNDALTKIKEKAKS